MKITVALDLIIGISLACSIGLEKEIEKKKILTTKYNFKNTFTKILIITAKVTIDKL
jgi:hypothetical protein